MSNASPSPRNTLTITEDGPMVLFGCVRASANAAAETKEVALCRCGHSDNKPWCDGSHAKVGFRDPGHCAKAPEPVAHAPAGEVVLQPIAHGPLRIDGRFELATADGKRYACGDKTWLCRCGHSATKPFCDGTHKKTGFST